MGENDAITLYIIRHGETEWNLAGVQQGHLDSALTARGIRQAEALAEGLSGRGIDAIVSSDLGRATATAEIIAAKLGLPFTIDARLRERHLGSMQGMTKEDFRAAHPDEWARFASGDPDYVFPGGESARQRYERTVAGVADIARRHAGRTVLIVAHGGVLEGVFRRAVNLPLDAPRGYSLSNAAINRLTITATDWRLDTWGDIAHLKGETTLDDN